jgi:hypothetical protein
MPGPAGPAGPQGPVGPPGPPSPSGSGSTLFTGGTFPYNIGCVFCDGQARYIGPGFSTVSTGNRAVVATPFPAGTVKNLRVQFSGGPDLGNWGIFVEVTGGSPAPSGGLGCSINGSINPGLRTCTSIGGANATTFGDGALLTVTIGHDGSAFSAGGFAMTYSFEFVPAP